MRENHILLCAALSSAAFALAYASDSNGPSINSLPMRNPDAIVDLRDGKSAALVHAVWKVAPLELKNSEFPQPGVDNKPTGTPKSTLDVATTPFTPGFDDSGWQTVSPDDLESRRSSGRFAGEWYRLHVSLPKTVGSFPIDDAVAVLEIVADDYAEIYVDGKLPLMLGGTPNAISGWNAPQRVVLTEHATAGQHFEITILVHNGPLSKPPANYVWLRSATLDLYSKVHWRRAEDVELTIEIGDPRLLNVVAKGAYVERIATGFQFTEGPCVQPDGSLLCSDPNRNVVYRISENDGVTVYRTKSGYAGVDIGLYRQPGSNGLALDSEGRLTLCEHGNRRVTRLEKNGSLTVLADRFEGKRLNSPNDLTYRSDGALFFTDPPFGLPNFHDDSRRELPHFGVYCLKDGILSLVTDELRGPNGLDFSPDERTLYVANWDEKAKTITRYVLDAQGKVVEHGVFADLTEEPGDEALDGLKVDALGNVFVSGPGGIFVFAADGAKLGRLVLPELPANFAFADSATSTLWLTARSGIYRLHLRPHLSRD